METDRAAYDLCSFLITAGNLYDARRTVAVQIESEYIERRALNPMPDELRLVAFMMGSELISRPTKRGASTKFERDLRLLMLVRSGAEQFQLSATRASATRPRRSACDAVIEAMRRERITAPTFDALKRIWHNTELSNRPRLYSLLEDLKQNERADGEDAHDVNADWKLVHLAD